MAGPKKKADEEGRRIFFLDESGLYLQPLLTRVYSLRGLTPVLRAHKNRSKLSLISVISPDGQWEIARQNESFTTTGLIRFFTDLTGSFPGKWLVIWDNASIHKSQEFKDFLASEAGAHIDVEYLPPYAPELNPDEGIWAWLKRKLRNYAADTLGHLADILDKTIIELDSRTDVILACFKRAGLV